jgi:putative nucleotidyltransferase with HDIG domain
VAAVASYLERVQQLDPIVLNEEQRHEELTMDLYRTILIDGRGTMRVDTTYSNAQLTQLRDTLLPAARAFPDTLAPKIIDLTIRTLKESPTHLLNETRTLAAQNQASDLISPADAQVSFNPKDVLVHQGKINDKDWEILRAENEAFLHRGLGIWKSRAGTASVAALLTLILAAYIARFQPRIVRNQARGMAIAGLMFLMLIVAQLAGLSSSPTYLFGVAPTILVAMILTIAYEQRFAIGVSTIHAALVTMALNESHAFFLVLWIGVLSCCLLLDDIRTRDKLILVGFATALALIIASCAASLLQLVPPSFMLRNALFAGASGLGVGFVVLGILPFIEKWFKITTSMTLMELADSSQPLLRRLALEAPGTYHHSMQVATLSAESAEAIGADSLLCRVGAYYHDIGKINKPDYFVENQSDGKNRHLSLSPNVSYLIIIGHVKDGVAMAKEYNLPTKLLPFIEQHHGTTLIEWFYKRACDTCDPDGPKISDTQFRYAGPKPKSKEIAIVMLADAVESATRAMAEPTSARIESLVHELAMKRLLDGQFDECDLTMRDLERIERTLAKTLQSFYHARIPYPSNRPAPAPVPADQQTATRSA